MVTVADEVWLTTAMLHRDQPERETFTVAEILERARLEAKGAPLRPGFSIHVSYQAVANKPPNPARTRMLYATGHGTRRLFRSGDQAHPERTGRTVPNREDIPEKYHPLLDWYRDVYDRRPASARTLRERNPAPHAPASSFADAARDALSRRYGVPLPAGAVPGVPGRFDFVAPDGSVVGDADVANIAEHVWLLEKTAAPTKLLVFGGAWAEPADWVRRYGHLAPDVRFYLFRQGGSLEELSPTEATEGGWNPLSSAAFARDWDSVEDSVYDDLPAG